MFPVVLLFMFSDHVLHIIIPFFSKILQPVFVSTAISGGGSQLAAAHVVVHPTWLTKKQYFSRTFTVEPLSPFLPADDHLEPSPHDLAYRKYRSSLAAKIAENI
jgi:hypothetical protein